MSNFSSEELAFFANITNNKEIIKIKRKGEKLLAKYSEDKYLRLSMVKRSELLELDDQFIAMMGPAFKNSLDRLLKKQKLNSDIINEIFMEGDPRCVIPIKTFMESGGTNTGPIDIHFCSYRYSTFNGRTFTIRDNLLDQLLETNIGDKTPMSFLRLPYNNIYLEFGESRKDRGLYLSDPKTGNHILEGAYINESETHVEYIKKQCKTDSLQIIKYLNIDVNEPLRVLQICYTGSPLGKSGNLNDDCYINYYIYIPHETDMSLEELVNKHIDFYTRHSNRYPRFNAFNKKVDNLSDENAESFKKIFNATVTAFLYLNSKESIVEQSNEYTEGMKRVNKLKPSKRKREINKVYVKVDRNYIGGVESENSSTPQTQRGSVSVHWRRGHFRSQRHGEGLKDTKLIWIKPKLIGMKSVDEANIKDYKL